MCPSGGARCGFFIHRTARSWPISAKVQGERILCVANVSRAPQAVELDLAEFKDAVPIELTAGSLFPAIDSRSYLLTLPAYGFFWFRLEAADATKDRHDQQAAPGLFTLVATGKLETILAGRELIAFERTVAPRFLPSRRWFGPEETPVAGVSVKDFAVLRDGGQSRFVLPILDVKLLAAGSRLISRPLRRNRSGRTGRPCHAAARLRRGALTGLLYEADACEGFAPGDVGGAPARRKVGHRPRAAESLSRRRRASAPNP